MSQKEIPVSDDELAALMAELEEATGVSAEAPAPTPVPSRVATPDPEPEEAPPAEAAGPDDEELAALAALEEPAAAPAPEPVAETPVVESVASVEEDDTDAQLAALEAQLERANQAEAEKVVAEPEPLPSPEPEPAPEPTPEPTPRRVVVNADGTKTMPSFGKASPPAPANEEDDGMPAPKAKAPALDFYVDVDDFRRTTTPTETNLDECMIQQSGLRAFYGAQAARAEAQHARLKVRFEVLEAKLYDEHRKQLAAGSEKVTEKAVENAIRLDPRYLQGKTRVIEAESIANVNRAMVDSLRDRASMVIQLCADRRDEFKGQARLMAQQQERDDLRNRALTAARSAA